MNAKILVVLALLATTSAQAAVDFAKLRQADKIAISLTGQPLDAALKAKFIKGEVSLEDIANQLSSSPGFIEHYAHYWTKTLGMQTPIEVYNWQNKNGNYFRDSFGYNYWHLGGEQAPDLNVKELQGMIDKYKEGPVELKIRECADAPLIYMHNSDGMVGTFSEIIKTESFGGSPILSGTKPYWQQLLNIAQITAPDCDAKDSVLMQPWWDPESVTIHSRYKGVKQYRVVPNLATRCGPKMINCGLRNAEVYDGMMDQVNQDISLEPAYIIAHTVAEDKPFSDVLTTQSTIYTGSLGYFFSDKGKFLWESYPAGTITDIKHPIFTAPNRLDRKHYWIKRGPAHAGILTTPSFQIITNGRRAKANRTYETFLCKKFFVPEGAKADPADANPDLTKRTYCEYCHKSLEPMAAFFNRWPTTGVNKYLYDSDPNIVDKGRFNGVEGNGAAALGKIVSDSEDFDSCSISRAFEFVNGRKMSSYEIENKLPGYLTEFQSSSKNLRNIIKEMVVAPEFLTPKVGGK